MKNISTSIADTLAYNLRHYRQELGLSQNKVARAAGISYRLLQELEGGKGNPTIGTITALARTFKVSSDRMLQLNYLRPLSAHKDHLGSLQRTFEDASVAFTVRTPYGLALWGNARSESLLGHQFTSGPVDLVAHYPEDAARVLKEQLGAERRAHVHSYIMFVNDADSGERRYIRCHPTLILAQEGSIPLFVAEYFAQLHDDCVENYAEYCRLLFDSLHRLTPRARKKQEAEAQQV